MSQEKRIVACGQCGAKKPHSRGKDRRKGALRKMRRRHRHDTSDVQTTGKGNGTGKPVPCAMHFLRHQKQGSRKTKWAGPPRCGKCREPIETQGLLFRKVRHGRGQGFRSESIEITGPGLVVRFRRLVSFLPLGRPFGGRTGEGLERKSAGGQDERGSEPCHRQPFQHHERSDHDLLRQRPSQGSVDRRGPQAPNREKNGPFPVKEHDPLKFGLTRSV